MHPAIDLSETALAQFCKRHGIRRLSLFGSQLKGTARIDSDVDLLVDFEPERIPGLLGISAMEIVWMHNRLVLASPGARS